MWRRGEKDFALSCWKVWQRLSRGAVRTGAADDGRLSDDGKKMMLQIAMGNAVIANSDRHSSNMMHFVDVDGNHYPVVIDNGFSSDNGWGPAKYGVPLGKTPGQYAAGDTDGARNVNSAAARKILRNMPEAEAKQLMVEFAQRMRDRAELIRFRDNAERDFFLSRAQWIVDNIDEMYRAMT